MEKQKIILISGAAGFIGRNLIENLSKDILVKKIIAIDNFISSDKDSFLDFLVLHKKVKFFEFDITKEHLTDYEINTLDEIYHLASIASPIFYKKLPIQTLDVGYLGTKNMLEIAKKYNSKILFSSTSEVYGDAKVSPQSEDYYGNVNSFGERSNYDESKRIAEALCYTYIKQFNLDVKIARIFNTFGPHMMLNDGRIITECIKALKYSTTLTIFGDGTQTRSISFISDTISQLLRLMKTNCNIPVNIGNNIEISINKTVSMIEKIYGNTLKIKFCKLTQNDPLQRCPCLKLNNKVLGKTDYTKFKDGIIKTIDYFNST